MNEERAEYRPEWKPDCQGKWDYDCDLVSLSCRYWPQGGGFHVLDTGKGTWEGNEARPEIRPSAKASICIGDLVNGPYEEMASADFDGNTEAEVKAKVEEWAKEMITRADSAIRREFNPIAAAEIGKTMEGEKVRDWQFEYPQENPKP